MSEIIEQTIDEDHPFMSKFEKENHHKKRNNIIGYLIVAIFYAIPLSFLLFL